MDSRTNGLSGVVKPLPVRTALLLLILLLLAPSGLPGDYFPYRPRRLTFEFAVPFDDATAPKLTPAKLTITTQPDENGRYPLGFGFARLATFQLELGRQRVAIPHEILRDAGSLDLRSLDLYWVGMRHFVTFNRPTSAPGERPDRVKFVFDAGVLSDYRLNEDSQRGRFPNSFAPTKPK